MLTINYKKAVGHRQSNLHHVRYSLVQNFGLLGSTFTLLIHRISGINEPLPSQTSFRVPNVKLSPNVTFETVLAYVPATDCGVHIHRWTHWEYGDIIPGSMEAYCAHLHDILERNHPDVILSFRRLCLARIGTDSHIVYAYQ